MFKPYLKTFVTVCEKGSFTKAAAELFITPSAVIQQINALENDLSVTLFIRTPKGICLTSAGEYLLEQAKDLLHRGEQVRHEIRAVSGSVNEICVGTSLLEKCRLLYDLWVLFSEREKDYSIRMVNIVSLHSVPDQAELVESVNGNMSWTDGWEFMEICQVPFGFAFSREHPLSKKKMILPEDLRGETVVSINSGTSVRISAMLDSLKHLGVDLVLQEASDSSALWENAFRYSVQVAPLCWDDILINMIMRPCKWEHSMPYGIFYKKNASPAVQEFLSFIRQTYEGQDPARTVWTLS